ncbi:MAG: hypothetical protein ACKO4T_06650 [Planctomycetaceae bacterium]
MAGSPRATVLPLNVAHALDHLVLLVFATAVIAIAPEFGIARWEDLMPYRPTPHVSSCPPATQLRCDGSTPNTSQALMHCAASTLASS